MAMSREDQKAASDRIMAKFPLTLEEQQTYKMLTMKPEDYPKSGPVRVCGICGAEFETIPAMKEHLEITVLQQFSDHSATHNPSPAQWTEAHNRIQKWKQQAKESS
jgi:hypothetical protein